MENKRYLQALISPAMPPESHDRHGNFNSTSLCNHMDAQNKLPYVHLHFIVGQMYVCACVYNQMYKGIPMYEGIHKLE